MFIEEDSDENQDSESQNSQKRQPRDKSKSMSRSRNRGDTVISNTQDLNQTHYNSFWNKKRIQEYMPPTLMSKTQVQAIYHKYVDGKVMFDLSMPAAR